MKRKLWLVAVLLGLVITHVDNASAGNNLYFSGSRSNGLFSLLKDNGIPVTGLNHLNVSEVNSLPVGSTLIIVSDQYPHLRTPVTQELYRTIENRSIRLFIEYPEMFPGDHMDVGEILHGDLERGVVTSDFFGDTLPSMSLLGINDCHIIATHHSTPLISYAKVAGFDTAAYGLDDTDVYPLLVEEGNMLIAMTSFSNFSRGRYGPSQSWKAVWESILNWLLDDKGTLVLNDWPQDPGPSFMENDCIDDKSHLASIQRGAEWYFNSNLLLHPTWKRDWLELQGDGRLPIAPPLDKDILIGDGSMGILEGHASTIYGDGSQAYRYWIRYDVQGEAAFALAASGSVLDNTRYRDTAEKLMDFLFYNSNSKELSSDSTKGTYGLLGWSQTHPQVMYQDDNARLILGIIGASSYLNNQRWNKLIVENILANYRISSKYGFQGRWLNAHSIIDNGWEHYANSDVIRAQPHFEAWMPACYIWLYNKTGYQPLLDKAKTAISIMMEAYPDNWRWTNGIQQERARMILPLAWLVRVDDSEKHKEWLVTLVDDLLQYQEPNGALREQLGSASLGSYGRSPSNADYGKTEAPLIFENGDKVADMLYTNNFALFTLNEAAKSTGIPRFQQAADNLSDFLTRIQIRSDAYPDLDGGWFRAFDYGRWDYWASNADAGWGAWCTLSGWIQSWIVGTRVLMQEDQSFWDKTSDIELMKEFEESLWMLIPSEEIE